MLFFDGQTRHNYHRYRRLENHRELACGDRSQAIDWEYLLCA